MFMSYYVQHEPQEEPLYVDVLEEPQESLYIDPDELNLPVRHVIDVIDDVINVIIVMCCLYALYCNSNNIEYVVLYTYTVCSVYAMCL